jgi:hypothetical protein
VICASSASTSEATMRLRAPKLCANYSRALPMRMPADFVRAAAQRRSVGQSIISGGERSDVRGAPAWMSERSASRCPRGGGFGASLLSEPARDQRPRQGKDCCRGQI